MLQHATNYGPGYLVHWAYATGYKVGMPALPEIGCFAVVRLAPWVFRYGDYDGQVSYPSYGQLHACPWGVGRVVKGVLTPFICHVIV